MPDIIEAAARKHFEIFPHSRSTCFLALHRFRGTISFSFIIGRYEFNFFEIRELQAAVVAEVIDIIGFELRSSI